MSAPSLAEPAEAQDDILERMAGRFDHHDPALGIGVIYDVYNRLLEGPPIQRTEAHGGFTMLTRFADVVHVSKHPEIFSSQQDGVRHPPIAGAPRAIPAEIDRPLHNEYRRLFLNILSPPKVRDAEPFLTALTEGLVRDYVAGPQTDFVQDVAVQLPIRAVGALVGWDIGSSDEMQHHVEVMQLNYGKPEGIEAMQALGRIAQVEIDARRAEPRGDYLTTLVNTRINGQLLTDDELQNIIRTFIFAGFETTAHMIASIMVYLAEHPKMQERIRADDEALVNFMEEAVRLFPPVHSMFRRVRKPTKIRDTQFAPGDRVGMFYGAANRDPEQFDHPNDFDIDRPNIRQHLSFGFGAHLCAGSQLARTEMTILLKILRKYPIFRLSGPPGFPPHLMGGQMMGPEHLPISFNDKVPN